MSEWQVRVVQLSNIQKHPNADTLSVVNVDNGYPCIFKTGDFKEGDIAVYIPVDSICPDTPQFEFLGKNKIIKAKRLRSVFSMGILVPTLPGMKIGDIVDQQLNITKYEPEIEAIGKGKLHKKTGSVLNGENAPDLHYMPVYTDIESMRKWQNVLQENEEVVISEKIHGASARFIYKNGKLYVGSHKCIKRNPWDVVPTSWFDKLKNRIADSLYKVKDKISWFKCKWLYEFVLDNRTRELKENIWTKAAIQYDLINKLKEHENIAIYGEVFGQVQDLKYGAKNNEIFLRLFDAYDTVNCSYLNDKEFVELTTKINVPIVPILYRGKWNVELCEMRHGNTLIENANHLREGFVVKPIVERKHPRLGRVILKYVSEEYLLR